PHQGDAGAGVLRAHAGRSDIRKPRPPPAVGRVGPTVSRPPGSKSPKPKPVPWSRACHDNSTVLYSPVAVRRQAHRTKTLKGEGRERRVWTRKKRVDTKTRKSD